MHLFDDLIKPEKQALFYATSLIAGIVVFHQTNDASQTIALGAAIVGISLWVLVVVITRKPIFTGFAARCGLAALIGVVAACLQFIMHPQQTLSHGITVEAKGVVTAIDGAFDRRIRLWVELDRAYEALSTRPDPLVRVSIDHMPPDLTVGDRIGFKARLYPSPKPAFPHSPDYALQAQIRDIVASGFIIGEVKMQGDQRDELADRLMRFRHRFATRLQEHMGTPTGGIAAALIVGDRRFISEETYEDFRKSGLAHLLAISGLHMGLLCFGVIAALRAGLSLMPGFAMRIPAHKFAAIAGVISGLGYVFISGASISAVRAFIMAFFVISAILLDRLALTLRNVALTAMLVLLINPAALYTASFQLSFAATIALVAWYEFDAKQRHINTPRRNKLVAYAGGVIVASIVAASATAPFTAQHFGTATPWGILANIFGIPLTGLWIMPTGILVGIGYIIGFESFVTGLMQNGINVLIIVARFVATLPLAGWRIFPPGYTTLVVLLIGLLVLLGCHRRMFPLGMLLICFAAVIWWRLPVPQGVLFAQGQVRFLVLTGQDGIARVHSTQNHRKLSSFFTDIAERELAHPVVQSPICKPLCTGYLPDGRKVSIVDRTFNLTKACKSEADMIISLVPVKYACRSGIHIYDITLLYGYNSLIYIRNNENLFITNNFESDWQVCPAPQPHHC